MKLTSVSFVETIVFNGVNWRPKAQCDDNPHFIIYRLQAPTTNCLEYISPECCRLWKSMVGFGHPKKYSAPHFGRALDRNSASVHANTAQTRQRGCRRNVTRVFDSHRCRLRVQAGRLKTDHAQSGLP
ncbi:hypothetical protein T4D_805 [Trichinella pseudospiralis]|uniref:Uncharacterized protein n=1 Tax=Trichinella pseudospiralis TaxID=6337 RepID=A0A0V1F7T8_TRIPS|nr:hypothetical protein T4D_805 [Trichinella pseudospiralis]